MQLTDVLVSNVSDLIRRSPSAKCMYTLQVLAKLSLWHYLTVYTIYTTVPFIFEYVLETYRDHSDEGGVPKAASSHTVPTSIFHDNLVRCVCLLQYLISSMLSTEMGHE